MVNLNHTSKLLLSSLMACALLAGCDKQEAKADENKAEEKTEADKELEERLAKKRAEREAKEKAEAEEAEKVKALAVLPEEMPKDLDAACEAFGVAYDGFMQKILEGDKLTQWDGAKAQQIDFQKKTCQAGGSVEVAACQAKALTDAPKEFGNKLTQMLDACKEKFGGAAGGEAPAGG